MWLIRYHAVPKADTPAFAESGGAYVQCWILWAWQDGAENLARFEVEKEWIITENEETSWYEPDDFTDDDDNKQYVDEAMMYGGCFVFHHYPLNALESDEDFDVENATTSNRDLLKKNH
ncbi:MAG: hypothetical protein ABI791_00770 [Acidobacteriota bacterium]